MGIRNLGSLEVFVALADTQSFTEAAKRMGMTTSAASQALKALEKELAVALISRKSRPVMLTGAGRNLLDGARALLRDARELETAVTISSPILPLLRLGLAESVSCTVGADIVGALFPCTKQLSVRTAMAVRTDNCFVQGKSAPTISAPTVQLTLSASPSRKSGRIGEDIVTAVSNSRASRSSALAPSSKLRPAPVSITGRLFRLINATANSFSKALSA